MGMQTSQAITRRSASNLAFAFIALGREKREAMSVLYAFCREVDDVADEDTRSIDDRRESLAEWREDVKRACEGGEPRMAVNEELKPVVQCYKLPFSLFDELLLGVETDLRQDRYETLDELDLYCYRVASVVGLLSIEIFGYRDSAVRDYAIHLGKALQITNILRDVRNDAERGRIYLPREELRRCEVDEASLLSLSYSSEFHHVAADMAVRARMHYQKAAELLPKGERCSMVAAESMGAVYWNILRVLERDRFQVFEGPMARLGKTRKLWLIIRTWLRIRLGMARPNYGLD
ncbi:MAG: squalene synthase HpnD [Verrucomicrobiales bacterium]|nr:squalene synthase HpnD [Verrucomicrobiales bacterium]